MNDLFGYAGKRVVVTGCSSGIGEATARILLSLDASVIGMDIKDPTIDIENFIRVDMANTSSIEAAVSGVGSDVRALFNCAGISSGAGSSELVIAINFLGLRCLSELMLHHMTPGSAIANVSSLDGYSFRQNFPLLRSFLDCDSNEAALSWWESNRGSFPKGGYSFSKQAMIAFTMLRGTELASQQIRMNSIGPGITDTPILADSVRKWGPDFVAKVPKPLGRSATASEQAWPLVFLNSDLASHITAEHLCTDAGVANAMELGLVDGQWFAAAPAAGSAS